MKTRFFRFSPVLDIWGVQNLFFPGGKNPVFYRFLPRVFYHLSKTASPVYYIMLFWSRSIDVRGGPGLTAVLRHEPRVR